MQAEQAKEAYRLINACFDSLVEAHSLLQREPQLIVACTGLGETALHYLAVEDQLPAVQWLVDRGAAVNTVNNVGTTPLSDAASLGYVEMVAYLLSAGARVDLPGETDPTLHAAVRGANTRVVSMLLEAGGSANAVDKWKESALHVAAESDDRLAVLRTLLEAGANADARCSLNDSPLDVAIDRGSAECAAALRAFGRSTLSGR